jgi:hypothetical protein
LQRTANWLTELRSFFEPPRKTPDDRLHCKFGFKDRFGRPIYTGVIAGIGVSGISSRSKVLNQLFEVIDAELCLLAKSPFFAQSDSQLLNLDS